MQSTDPAPLYPGPSPQYRGSPGKRRAEQYPWHSNRPENESVTRLSPSFLNPSDMQMGSKHSSGHRFDVVVVFVVIAVVMIVVVVLLVLLLVEVFVLADAQPSHIMCSMPCTTCTEMNFSPIPQYLTGLPESYHTREHTS